jgi:hypothetical protein
MDDGIGCAAPMLCGCEKKRKEEKRKEEKRKEGEPTGLAPAVAFLTGADGHGSRRRCAVLGGEEEKEKAKKEGSHRCLLRQGSDRAAAGSWRCALRRARKEE